MLGSEPNISCIYRHCRRILEREIVSVIPAGIEPQGMIKAMSTWYHVTDQKHLGRIASEGLHGRQKTGSSNFPMVPVKGDAVYLWPEIGAAEAWSARDITQNPILLKVEVDDDERIWPDHEAISHWIADIGDQEANGADISPLANSFVNAVNDHDTDRGHVWAREVDHDFEDEEMYLSSWDIANHVPLEGMIAVLSEMDPGLRSQLAEHIARVERSAVMHEGAIGADCVQVAEFMPDRAGVLAEGKHSQDLWRGHLNTRLNEEVYDNMGALEPARHMWHELAPEAVEACYQWHALAMERPEISAVETSGVRPSQVDEGPADTTALSR